MRKERATFRVACYVFVYVKGKLLLMKRKASGCDDGLYTIPSGHMEREENPIECAIRETFEEIGVKIKEMSFSSVGYRNSQPLGEKCLKMEYIDFFFICKNFEGIPQNREEDKCSEIIYVDVNNIPDNVVPCVKIAINNLEDSKLMIS